MREGMVLAEPPVMKAPAVNFVTIVVLVATAGANVGPFFGVHDPVYAVMFVSAWMLPISRLRFTPRPSEWSLVSHPGAPTARPTWFLVLGAAPWIALPLIHTCFPDSLAWRSLPMPVPFRWIGMALTVGLFCGPFLTRSRYRAAGDSFISPRAYAMTAAAVVLTSVNLFIAVLALAGAMCLYLSSRKSATLDVADGFARRLAVPDYQWEERCQTVS